HDLAEMWISLEAARGLCYRAACTAVDGKYPRLMDVTAAKVFSNDVALKVTQKAMILHGGDGATMNFPIQRLWRDAMAGGPVAGGSPAVLRNMIASQILNRKLDQRK
ncbi:MAG: acyl-CoA dehydrogenase family protein, partial [Dehalococcoidia bacterium]|nr:acyl-CoA dehydrogenase family protein [Dehalococcoidia bacterium]